MSDTELFKIFGVMRNGYSRRRSNCIKFLYLIDSFWLIICCIGISVVDSDPIDVVKVRIFIRTIFASEVPFHLTISI